MRSFTTSLIAAAAVTAAAGLAPGPATAADLRLMTGPQGGSGCRSAASSRTCGRRRSPA